MPDDAAAAAKGGEPRPCGICALIERCRAGGFPDLIAELPHSYVILGDAQFYRGYCVMLAKRHIHELHLMAPAQAHELFGELIALGQAIAAVTRPLKLNYECLGNIEPHVHWHVFPRYEADPLRAAPVWVRPEAERKLALEDSDRQGLIRELGAELRRRIVVAH